MDATYAWVTLAVGLGLLAVRLVLGTLLAAHGTRKRFGWFRGPGPRGTAEFLESPGFHPGRAPVLAAGLAELAGGLLVLLGFLALAGPGAYSLDALPRILAYWTPAMYYWPFW